MLARRAVDEVELDPQIFRAGHGNRGCRVGVDVAEELESSAGAEVRHAVEEAVEVGEAHEGEEGDEGCVVGEEEVEFVAFPATGEEVVEGIEDAGGEGVAGYGGDAAGRGAGKVGVFVERVDGGEVSELSVLLLVGEAS